MILRHFVIGHVVGPLPQVNLAGRQKVEQLEARVGEY
jgi:hypothetical protein